MRTEKEILDMAVQIAREDDRILAAFMTGSRADTDAPKDKYRDYDIVYLARDIKPFYNNMEWIREKFGMPAVLQRPELNVHPMLLPIGDGTFNYLMLFEDGVRIDLSFEFPPYLGDGEPVVVLLDKEGILNNARTDENYWHVKCPKEDVYHDVCNNFWWCLNNVAKGIGRDELPYAKEMFDYHVRSMLNQMVSWYIGITHDFAVSSGKMGKYFKRYLSADLYEMYAATYSDADYENFWKSVFTAGDLFRNLALLVAKELDFQYNKSEDENIIKYLLDVKNGRFV